MIAAHPTWSVLIVFYADLGALANCLAAVERQKDADLEILVVDNQGQRGIDEVVAGAMRARLLSPGRNTGYGGGNNLAAAAARGQYLCILNPDVLPRPDLLKRLGSALERLPQGALVTPTLLLPDGHVNAQGNDVTYTGLTTCRELGASRYCHELRRVPAVSGAAFAVRRDEYLAYGGFDEQFFLYLEDTDLSLRVNLAGGSCWCDGGAIATHDYHWRFSPFKQRELEKNRLQLLYKLFRRRTLMALLPGLLLTEACTLAYAVVRGPAYFSAKLGAYTQFGRLAPNLRARRRQVQAQRRLDDAALLALCSWRVPFRQQLGPLLGSAMELLSAPFFATPYAVARLLGRHSTR